MINGSVVKPTEIMNERETMETFCDGLGKCASAARELAIACNNPEWDSVAGTLEAICVGGKKLADMKAMNRLETLMAANIKSTPYKPN